MSLPCLPEGGTYSERTLRVVLIDCAWRNWCNILAHEFLAPIHVVFSSVLIVARFGAKENWRIAKNSVTSGT
jgi:hypothetical protein